MVSSCDETSLLNLTIKFRNRSSLPVFHLEVPKSTFMNSYHGAVHNMYFVQVSKFSLSQPEMAKCLLVVFFFSFLFKMKSNFIFQPQKHYEKMKVFHYLTHLST